MQPLLRRAGASVRLLDSIARPLFGDDIFVSYSRRDTDYALRLANSLVDKGLSPYLDQWASTVGAQLPWSLKRALTRASMMVVIATCHSAISTNVEAEIREFLLTFRAICIVDVGSAFSKARWRHLVPGLEPIPEEHSALEAGLPSAEMVKRLLESVRFVRARRRIRTLAFVALALISTGAVASLYLGNDARLAKIRANGETRRAEEAAKRANLASDREKLASRNARESESERDSARSETEELEKRSNSIKFATRSREVIDVNPLAGLRFGLRALEPTPTPEAEAALRFALAAPRPSQVLEGQYREISFGRDWLLTIGKDGRVSVWDYHAGQRYLRLDAEDVITAEWNRDGTGVIVTTSVGRVEAWDVATRSRTCLMQFEAGSVQHASFDDSDGTILTAHSDGTIRRTRCGASAQELNRFQINAPAVRVWFLGDVLTVWAKDESGGYQRLAWRRNQETDLTALGPFSEIYVEPPAKGTDRYAVLPDQIQDLDRLEQLGSIFKFSGRHLAVSNDGQSAVTGWQHTATVWNVWTKQAALQLSSHETNVTEATFSPDSKQVATLTEAGVVRVWHLPSRMLTTGSDQATMKRVTSMSFSKDGTTLATGDAWGGFLLWDLGSGRAKDVREGPKMLSAARSRVSFSSDDKLLLTSTEQGHVEVWDWRSGVLLASRELPVGSIPRFSSSGAVLVTAPKVGGVLLLNMKTGLIRQFEPNRNYCNAVMTPDEEFVIAVNLEGAVTVRRVADWTVVSYLQNPPGGCSELEVDETDSDYVLVFNRDKALFWRWLSKARAIQLEEPGQPIVDAKIDVATSLVTLATLSDVRLYDISDFARLQQMSDAGTENNAVGFRRNDHLVAVCQEALGTGYYVLLRQCLGCVSRDRLGGTARGAISKLTKEYRKWK